MRNGIKKKIILLMCMVIISFITLLSLNTTSYGNTQTVSGITWYYDVVDGEAVNVYISSGRPGTTLTVPSTLGGYPVTGVIGPVISRSQYTILGNDSQRFTTQRNVTSIVLPSTLKTIGDSTFSSFYNATSINLPEGLETIGPNAFKSFGSNSINITIPNSVTSIGGTAFENSNASRITLGTGITTIENRVFKGCRYLENMHIPSNVTTMYYDSFTEMKDIYVDNTKESIEILGARGSYNTNYPYIHFLGDTKTISSNIVEGISIVDTATNEEITNNSYEVGSNVTFRVDNLDSNKNYVITLEYDPDYIYAYYPENNKNVFMRITLDQNNTYTIENLKRNIKIYIQEEEQGSDLALRQYISKVSGSKIGTNREPEVRINNGVINYIQSKSPVFVGKNDNIEYTIRVYNEGNTDSTVNKIKYFIPQGLRYNLLSLNNILNNWQLSEDGTYATTELLNTQTIEAYEGATQIHYQEVTINLVVDYNASYDMDRVITIAEIQEASEEDVDSTFGDIVSCPDSSYMQEESLIPNSYIHAQDDDNDFEAISLSDMLETKYNLRINKIDAADNALLNGATFELLNEDMEVVKTGVTANGGVLDFGLVDAFGPGTKKYYVREAYTPEGYKNHLSYLIEVNIITEIEEGSESISRVELGLENIDVDTSKYQTIDINTKEDFMAMESNQTAKYILKQDIDLEDVTWTPINLENVVLDGNNHKISNLKIEVDESTNKKVGLFETYSGIIENLTLENVDIKVTKTSEEEIVEETEEDIHAVGGIVGYSKGTIFKNCKVTGKVESEVDNVGGFVGHSKKGTLDVYRSCTNEATVSTTTNNAGGMIGTALGPVQVISSTNKGNITAGVYNAGGMVGTAESQGYATEQVIGEYFDDNKSIQLTVKNERIKGSYKVEIEKIDAQDKNILAGAKFTLYNMNKEPIEGYEDIELTEGSLEIPKVVEHNGTDTYYLKETQAPDGYDKISDDYIKIEISKQWNKEIEEYISTGAIDIVAVSDFEDDEPKSENTSEVATGRTYSRENSDVEWRLNKVSISKNTVNEGKITSGNLNASGLLGRAKCDVTVTDSTNKGEIESVDGNSAGILSEQIVDTDSDNRLYVKNAKNIANIKQTKDSSVKNCASGIVAITNADNVEIYDSQNDGTIEASCAKAAGIVGNSASDILIIDNCINNGDISSTSESTSSGDVGGIIANSVAFKNFANHNNSSGNNPLNEHSKHKIVNCTNKGNLTGKCQIGGIIGLSTSKNLEIYKSKLEDTDIENSYSQRGMGGIAGLLCNENVVIDDCTVTNGSIKDVSTSSSTMVGGIVGIYQGMAGLYDSSAKQSITISNCKLKGLEITGKANTGGILGNVMENAEEITIVNCDYEDGTVKSVGTSSTYEQIGGILGYSDYGNVLIDNCNVKNTEIGLDAQGSVSGDNNIGGIVGGTVHGETLRIKNSTVEGCDIKNIANYVCQGNTGGIAGYPAVYNSVSIENSNVKETTIYADSGSVGGITGVVRDSQKTDIINCHVSDINIDGKKMGQQNTYSSGMVPYAFNEINIKDCTLTDSRIHNYNYSVAGVIGGCQGKTTIDNVIVDNSNMISDISYIERTSTSSGGIAGWSIGDITINNATIKNSLVESGTTNMGGILGGANSNSTITNCEVNKTIVKNTIDESSLTNSNYYSNSIGGIAGLNSTNDASPILENCKVINESQIISKVHSTGGIIGYTPTAVKNCTFEDSSIIMQSQVNNTDVGQVGGIAGFTSNAIENCNVKNINITANSETVGGIAGIYYNGSRPMKNCDIDTVTITHNNNISLYSGMTYSSPVTKHVGGAIGIVPSNMTIEDSTINNITINITGNKIDTHAGGIIGLINGIPQLGINQSIENITVNNKSLGMTGGMIGFVNSKDEIELSNYNLKNINITGRTHTGGMIGTATIAKFNNIVIEGLQAEETENSYTVGGLIGRVQVNGLDSTIKPIVTVNNIEVKALNNRDNIIKAANYSHAGVLVGLTERAEINTNAADKIKVTNTRVNSTANNAGLIAQTGRINAIKNIELENVRMISGSNAGGVIGLLNNQYDSEVTQTIEMSNIKETNVKVNTVNNAGGIVGNISSQKQLTIKDIELNNIETYADEHAGAITGFMATSELLNMNNITANKIKSTASYDVGGLIGISNNSLEMIADNITAEDVTVVAGDAKGNYQQNAGGLVGAAPNPKFSNIHITDVNVNSQHAHHIGGIIGTATQMNSNSSLGAEFKNITIDASEGKTNVLQATTTTSSPSSVYGGILIGFVNQKTKVDGTINIQNTTLKDNGGYYNSYSGFGGIVGFTNVYENPTTSTNNITLTNVDIIGTGRTGGILGDVYTLSNIHDIILQNVSVKTLNGHTAGGLIGMAMKQQKSTGSDITFDVSDISLSDVSVSGENSVQHIGGLVAYSPNVNISRVTGENVAITGNAPNTIGGLIGLTSMYNDATNSELETNIEDINLKNLTISNTSGSSNMGGIAGEVMKPRVKDVTLEDINITNNGGGSTGGVIGIVTNVGIAFSNTGMTSEGEFSNITIRKSEDAENVNTIVGSQGGSAAIVTPYGKILTNTTGGTSKITVSDTNLQARNGFAGIFGGTESGSDIKGVIANNVNITSGTSHSGVIAGHIKGNLSDCQVSNSSVISQNGPGAYVGGIVGLKEGATGIASCTLTGTTVESVSTYGVGGIAGFAKCSLSDCTVTDSSITANANGTIAVGGLAGGVVSGDTSEGEITNCNVIDTQVTANNSMLGGLVGLSDFTVSNSKVTRGTVTSKSTSSNATGGLLGRLTSTVSTTIKIDNCDVIDSTITSYSDNLGGIVGFSNNTINSSNVIGSTIRSNGTNTMGVGGIVGHGSNTSGNDTSVIACKVMDTTITGQQKVGGISGGAVAKIQNCYVGQKEGSTYQAGTKAVTITGTDSVGGIIGDPGIISADNQIMITMQGNSINNVEINRNAREREEGESDTIYALMGMHNRLDEEYEPEEPRSETITANTASNVDLNIN